MLDGHKEAPWWSRSACSGTRTGQPTAPSHPVPHFGLEEQHLQWSQRRSARHNRRHLAGGQVHGVGPRCKRGEEVGHTKVRHQDVQRVQASDEEVGGPQVPVQDAKRVKMQKPGHDLPQDGQDLGQGQAALGSCMQNMPGVGVQRILGATARRGRASSSPSYSSPPTSCLAVSTR